MNQKDLYMLLYLAQKTGLRGELETSTGKLAQDLGVSQQTVSRKLVDFAGAGIIDRIVTPTGVTIRISQQGRKHLYALYGDLQQLFSEKQQLRGVVQDGLGEGRFYMGQKKYVSAFQLSLGFAPYPGTLNLRVDGNAAHHFLTMKGMHYIDGFSTKERTFGGLKSYLVTIRVGSKQVQGAVVLPDRSVHTKDIIEIIAPTYLRETLNVKNGDTIIIE